MMETERTLCTGGVLLQAAAHINGVAGTWKYHHSCTNNVILAKFPNWYQIKYDCCKVSS
jgi:hypothetical protein